MERREFLKRVRAGMVALAGAFPVVRHLEGWVGQSVVGQESRPAMAAGIAAGNLKFPSRGATIEGYLAKPLRSGQSPAVLLIHDHYGLGERIRDVARGYAEQGFAALAPDLLSRHGGAGRMDSLHAAAKQIEALTEMEVLEDLAAAFNVLASNPSVQPDRIGVIGFAWGGQMAFRYAASNPKLRAAVVFDGAPPEPEQLESIHCPVLAHSGEADPQQGWQSTIAFLSLNLG